MALVTGAGSGIGADVARGDGAEGAGVALFGRTEQKLAAVADELPEDRSIVVTGAHEKTDDVRQAVRLVEASWGRLDFVFNNAGTYSPAPVAESSDELWNEAIASNLTGPFIVTRESLPLLRRQGGVIVNNASTLGIRPIPGSAAYCVAKAGLVRLTEATAIEEASHGVRALVICPGVVDTPIHAPRRGGTAEFLEAAGAMHPLGRVGSPADVANLVLFLAADDASWMTGAVVNIDGGVALA